MRIAVRVLGLDLFSIEIATDEPVEDDLGRDLSGGTLGAQPIGFVVQPGDQRWESGVETL